MNKINYTAMGLMGLHNPFYFMTISSFYEEDGSLITNFHTVFNKVEAKVRLVVLSDVQLTIRNVLSNDPLNYE